jgi:hypothetical protein
LIFYSAVNAGLMLVCRLVFSEFFTNEDARRMFIYVRPPRQMFASLSPPREFKGKIVVFYKKNTGVKLSEENIGMERHVMN